MFGITWFEITMVETNLKTGRVLPKTNLVSRIGWYSFRIYAVFKDFTMDLALSLVGSGAFSTDCIPYPGPSWGAAGAPRGEVATWQPSHPSGASPEPPRDTQGPLRILRKRL